MKSRIQSIKYAVEGFSTMLKDEPNARIHLITMVIVIVLSLYLKISPLEWVAIVIAIGLVFAAEAFNTSIEHVCNAVTLETNEYIKKSKDLAACAVLISAITAIIIGLVILGPKILALIANF